MHFQGEDSAVKVKRNHFMKDIRNIQREQIKYRARSLMIHHLSQQELLAFIQSTRHNITHKELTKLVKYANEQHPKAIAHLGNLIIDQHITIAQLDHFTLKPGHHPYWLWLIEILTEQQYCTLPLLEFCIQNIVPNRNQKSVSHSLSILYKITSSSLHSPLLLRDENILLKIINSSLRLDSAAKLSYLLMNEMVLKAQQGLSERFKEGFVRNRLIMSLKSGLLHDENIYRHFALKLIHSFSTQKVYFREIALQIIKICHSEAAYQFLDILLSFLSNFVIDNEVPELMYMLDNGLLLIFSKWRKNLVDEPSIYKIILICRQITQKTKPIKYKSNGIASELQKLDLMDFDKGFQEQK